MRLFVLVLSYLERVHTPKAFLFFGPNENPSLSSSFLIDLSLLSRIPGRPYKEPAEIKVERDDSLDRDSKDFSKQSSEKSSSKAKRKHKVWANSCFDSVLLNTFSLNLRRVCSHSYRSLGLFRCPRQKRLFLLFICNCHESSGEVFIVPF